MMKKQILSLTLILTFICISLQPVLATYPIIIGLSKFKKQDREVRNFTGVAAGGPIQVIITLGNTESLRFEGDADAISTLVSEVKGNVLVIRPQTSWTSWAHKYENKKIIAYVSVKTLKSLTMSGDGKMSVTGTIKTDAFTTTLSGSGSITASVNVNQYTAVISGSGNLNVSGSGDNSTITISGSGNFTKKDFAVDNLTAVVSGSGSINVKVSDSINAVISGSGKVNYSGNPSIEKRVIGSGGLRKI